MKSDYRLRAQKFVEQIFPYIQECESPYAYKRAMHEFNLTYHRHVEVASGASRVALISSDYVIKLDYDDGADSYGGCEDEVTFYNFAKEKGFDYLLAEITPFLYKQRTFYIMPRIEGIGQYEDAYVQDFLDERDLDFVENYLYDMHSGNFGWKNNYPIIVDYALNVFFDKRVQERVRSFQETDTDTDIDTEIHTSFERLWESR